jgi:hypothetical protein
MSQRICCAEKLKADILGGGCRPSLLLSWDSASGSTVPRLLPPCIGNFVKATVLGASSRLETGRCIVTFLLQSRFNEGNTDVRGACFWHWGEALN